MNESAKRLRRLKLPATGVPSPPTGDLHVESRHHYNLLKNENREIDHHAFPFIARRLQFGRRGCSTQQTLVLRIAFSRSKCESEIRRRHCSTATSREVQLDTEGNGLSDDLCPTVPRRFFETSSSPILYINHMHPSFFLEHRRCTRFHVLLFLHLNKHER